MSMTSSSLFYFYFLFQWYKEDLLYGNLCCIAAQQSSHLSKVQTLLSQFLFHYSLLIAVCFVLICALTEWLIQPLCGRYYNRYKFISIKELKEKSTTISYKWSGWLFEFIVLLSFVWIGWSFSPICPLISYFDLYVCEVELETPDRQLLEIDGAMLEGLSQSVASSSF